MKGGICSLRMRGGGKSRNLRKGRGCGKVSAAEIVVERWEAQDDPVNKAVFTSKPGLYMDQYLGLMRIDL